MARKQAVQGVTTKAELPVKTRKQPIQKNRLSTKLPYGMKTDMAETLAKLGHSPSQQIIDKLAEFDRIFEVRKEQLSFKEIVQFYSLAIKANTDILPYVYSRKAQEVRTVSVTSEASHSEMVEFLQQQAATYGISQADLEAEYDIVEQDPEDIEEEED